jgi:hypothetical protein
MLSGLDSRVSKPYSSLPEAACTYWANTGSTRICFSGVPKATTTSLWTYRPRVWKPRNRDTQLRWEIIASLCCRTRSRTLFLLAGIVVPNQEDGTVGKGPHHDEASDVLVVGVQSRHGGVVLRHEGIGGQRVHVLRHQRGDHTQGSQVPAPAGSAGSCSGVIETLVTFTQTASPSGGL